MLQEMNSPMNKVNITLTFIKNLINELSVKNDSFQKSSKNYSFNIEQGTQKIFRDSELSGFGIRVTQNAIVYIAEKKMSNGTPCRVTIGKHGLYTPDIARKEAKEHLFNMSKGINPNHEKQKNRNSSKQHSQGHVAQHLQNKNLSQNQIRIANENIPANQTLINKAVCGLSQPLNPIASSAILQHMPQHLRQFYRALIQQKIDIHYDDARIMKWQKYHQKIIQHLVFERGNLGHLRALWYSPEQLGLDRFYS